MNNVIECCARCGSTLIGKYPKMTICTSCAEGTTIESHITSLYRSKHPKSYYEGLSMQKYGTTEMWKEIFIDIELSREPTFSQEKYQRNIARQTKRMDMGNIPLNQHNTQLDKTNIPKCPTCQSTNIKKISALKRETHGFLFGIFSKTATSQFECENCGYKW